jgi:hypothetical protein
MEKYRKQCAEKGLPVEDEIVVLFAMFPQQVEALLKSRVPAASSVLVAASATPVAAGPPPVHQSDGRGKHLFVTLNGQRHDVLVETLEG